MAKISIIVPIHHWTTYLKQRLDSIYQQTYPNFEVILLVDSSLDDSLEILKSYAGRQNTVLADNETNSNSLFPQWQKGLEISRGEYIWVAEADDFASPFFLKRLVKIMDENPQVGLAYAQSWIVDRQGIICGSAKSWTDNLDPQRWGHGFINSGADEITKFLVYKNTIPCTSAVLLRKSSLQQCRGLLNGELTKSLSIKDRRLLWIDVLSRADIAFVPDCLNYWRQKPRDRHLSSPAIAEWLEGERMLNYVGSTLSLSESQTDKIKLNLLRRCWNDNLYLTPEFKVSVVVPNYNCAKYIEQRLQTILAQTVRPLEVIFLDDASSDQSLEIAKEIAQASSIPFKFIVNDENSGSPFIQWLKGIEASEGNLVWIAEADDYCDAKFIESLVYEFADPEVCLAYSQSLPVNEAGQPFEWNYSQYTKDLSVNRWQQKYCNQGLSEISNYLCLKNTIPNASAIVFRKPKSLDKFDKIRSFRFVGDWLFYVTLLEDGKISFTPEILNFHRRHNQTVTHNIEKEDKCLQEILGVKRQIFDVASISPTRISESLGYSIAEYYRLEKLHKVSKPDFTANESLKPSLEVIKNLFNDRSSTSNLVNNILMVIGDAEVGGGQIAGIRLANELAKNYNVFLCNARPDLFNPELLKIIDERVVLIEGKLGKTIWSSAENSQTSNSNMLSESDLRIKVLKDLIRFHQIDLIVSHIWWADRLVLKLNQELNIPWFIQMHGCYEFLMTYPNSDREFREFFRPMMQLVKGIFYLTDKNLRVFEALNINPPRFTKQLFNGFSKDDIRRAKKPLISRSEEDFVFCLCSRAIPEKGWEDAIAAVLAINELPLDRRSQKRAKLILIGDSDYARALRNKYQNVDDIEFTGHLSYPTEAIADCDVGLLPSRFVGESVPLTVIEYLACGKPVIATKIGSIPEMLVYESRKSGIIIPLSANREMVRDDLVKAMLMYMTNKTLYQVHQENSIFVFENLFDIKKIARKYVDFFEEAIVDSGSRVNQLERIRYGTGVSQ